MRKLVCLVVLLAAGASARAEWCDLKAGLDQKAVMQLVGLPLMQTKARSGLVETWTYDAGGYIQFERGLVRYWQAPRMAKKA